jgi:phosphate acetyltransferase
LVVPDIESGNALFKMMVHLMGAIPSGVVLGAKVPIVLTSRADSSQARLTSAAVARLMAERSDKPPAHGSAHEPAPLRT